MNMSSSDKAKRASIRSDIQNQINELIKARNPFDNALLWSKGDRFKEVEGIIEIFNKEIVMLNREYFKHESF